MRKILMSAAILFAVAFANPAYSCQSWEISTLSASTDLDASAACHVYLVSPDLPADMVITLPALAHGAEIRFIRVDFSSTNVRIQSSAPDLINGAMLSLGIRPTGYVHFVGTFLPSVRGWWVIDAGRMLYAP